MRRILSHIFPFITFVLFYVLLDWVSFIDPLYGLNITPWNPDPALGLAYWLKYGKKMTLPWFLALFISDGIVRGFPGGWLIAVVLAIVLTVSYGVLGEILRRSFQNSNVFNSRRNFLIWLAVVVVGTFVNSLVYVSLLYFDRLIPYGNWGIAVVRYWIGDIVGIFVSMPLIWIGLSRYGRLRLAAVIKRWETVSYIAFLWVLMLVIFGYAGTSEFNHFYFLFLPIVWAAARQGVAGAALVAFVLQIGVISITKWLHWVDIPIFELQLLIAVLAMGCFFIGVIVDEQKQLADELHQSLRLAAAGEMAAALTHELNQPMTALAAYGKACAQLLDQGETGPRLKDTIQRMIGESSRAAHVVRRLRDFFRTGAMQFEQIDMQLIVSAVTKMFADQFEKRGILFKAMPIPEIIVTGDTLQIELVLRNLLDNASDSVLNQPPDKRFITLSTELLMGGRLHVTVEDSGHGLSADLASRLFEPFVSSKSSGMGLGLVLSRAIIEAHGGKLWAEVADHGVFHFELPLAEKK